MLQLFLIISVLVSFNTCKKTTQLESSNQIEIKSKQGLSVLPVRKYIKHYERWNVIIFGQLAFL